MEKMTSIDSGSHEDAKNERSASGSKTLTKVKLGQAQLSPPAPSKTKVALGKINIVKAFEMALEQICPVIVEENEFCSLMFGSSLDAPLSSPTEKKELKEEKDDRKEDDEDEEDEEEDVEDDEAVRAAASAQKVKTDMLEQERKIKAELKQMHEMLFKGMEAYLVELVEVGDDLDHLAGLEMLYYTTKAIDMYGDDCEYLVGLLTAVQSKIKILFNTFVQDQLKWLEAVSGTAKKMHIGPPLLRLPGFVEQIEAASSIGRPAHFGSLPPVIKGAKSVDDSKDDEGSDSEDVGEKKAALVPEFVPTSSNVRDQTVESTYHKLITALFKWIEGIASQDMKYQAVVMTTNYHFFWMVFTMYFPPVPAMRVHVEQAQDLYMTWQEKYIKWHLEYAMPDAVQFWDLMENQLKALSQPTDLPAMNGLSKQQLKKLCSKHLEEKPLKEHVKEMWERVIKHFETSPDLLIRVWEATRNHFRDRYQRFEQLVADCYRSEKVPLSRHEVSALFSHGEMAYIFQDASASNTQTVTVTNTR
jgi:hypothetical protein